jgi:hypothetical protein
MEDNTIHTRDTAPLYDRQGTIFTGPPLGNQLGMNPVRSPPPEVLEIIDLTMDDDDEPIPNTLYHKDEAPVGWMLNNAPPFNAGRDTTIQGPKNLNQAADTQSAPSQILLESSPASWLAYLAKNPEQRPLRVRVDHEGIISTINLGIYLRISQMGISNPKGIKLSKEEEWNYSWWHYAFWHAVICVLTQPGHYEAQIAHLKLTVNPRSTNSLYRGPFDNGNDIEVDDAI